jgi:recombination protein RecA
MAKDNSFLKAFQKDLEKIEGVGTSSQPPRYWFSFGNYVLNKIMSGSFTKGVPQGRVTSLAGSSGAGKSFLAANLVKAAQDEGAIILIVDSENALDDDFMSKIGVDVETDEYMYASVTTVPQVTKVVSSFIKGYRGDWGTAEDAPPVLILIDSLDMLMTETEQEHYGKGVQKGDQGQRNKQLKAMLRTFVQDVKEINVTLVFTSQVYKNQDVTNGEGLWIVSDAVKYSASQIVLLSKLKLKDKAGGANETIGIRMKCEGYKTRFAKPFQAVTVEVPYETGMDPLSGLLEASMGLGVVVQKGSWYRMSDSDELWRAAAIADHKDEILTKCDALGAEARLIVDDSVVVDNSDFEAESPASRRKTKAASTEE